MSNQIYPFGAIVGQEQMKMALILNAVNPKVGGVLIRGEKGTAKSTAVRALAALLPPIKVREGCPYSCDPDDAGKWCPLCQQDSSGRAIGLRRTRVVTLPLNATEDRVAGGIDFHSALKKGTRILQPGLLADAHRGILYVDEVNLLDDHIVDIILDAAASGRNVVEREGISFTHPSCFILVGTMNPEEGELRPQLLDRFGLCVEVKAVADKDQRMLMMARREAYDMNRMEFSAAFEGENKTIARMMVEAKQRLERVRMPDHLRDLSARLCSESHVAGHRADLVVEQAAKALAAYRLASEVSEENILEIAGMVLLHRKRDVAPPPPPEQDHPHDHPHDPEDPPEERREDNHDHETEQPEAQPKHQNGEGSRPEETSPPDSREETESDREEQNGRGREHTLEKIFDIGETFKVKKIVAPKDRVFRRGSGRRSRTRISQKQGRYVKSTMGRHTGDVALDATLRAAAPHQLRRENHNGLAVVLKPEDIREKVRENRIGNFLLFVVDASGSMGARGRMAAAKGAIMSLLLDAYQKRDRIAMVSFRKEEAVINLPPTASVELAAALLREMPVGGRTPLSAGLARSHEVLRNYQLREPTARPIVILITDGRSNVALGPGKPLEETFRLGERLSGDSRIRFIIVDTEGRGLVRFGLAQKLAAAMNAEYFSIEDLKAETLVDIVKGEA